MIVDQYGNPFATTTPQFLSMIYIQAAIAETMRRSFEFASEIQGRVLDHRGDPVFSKIHKIGDTITIRKPRQGVEQ